jgi:DNA polymerase III alpha subunit
MGKALGFDPETLDKISAAVATWEFRDENDALDRRFRDAGLDLNHPRLRKYYELCLAVQDMPRHLGQHSGGMVICQGQLDSVVPLEPASMPGRVVVQWDKEDCADMGIVKVDLLGLGMMAVLKDSIELIRDHYTKKSIWRIFRRRPASSTKRCSKPTPSACFRWKAARKWRCCRACVRCASMTSWCRLRSSAPARSSARW